MFNEVKSIDEINKASTEELFLAEIPVVEQKIVPYMVSKFFVGELESWKFARMRRYWHAETEPSYGLPWDVAIKLYERPYLLFGKNEPKTFGEAVRVRGLSDNPDPQRYVKHFNAERKQLILDPTGELEKKDGLVFEENPQILGGVDFREKLNRLYVPSLEGIVVYSTIDEYHIDTIVGLKIFAYIVREVAQKRVV